MALQVEKLMTNPDQQLNTELKDYIFTSESVSEGHPDKVCDRISDTVLDLYMKADPYSRVACETLVTTDTVVLAGEVRGPSSITKDVIEQAAREAIKDIGYEQEGFHWKTAKIQVLLHAQSADIAQGVDEGSGVDTNEGAGDQGIMFGYANLLRPVKPDR
jgi:S-adenosylmethionine synthetase